MSIIVFKIKVPRNTVRGFKNAAYVGSHLALVFLYERNKRDPKVKVVLIDRSQEIVLSLDS